MAWEVVRALEINAAQANTRIKVPTRSIGKKAIVQISENSGSVVDLYTGLFWTSMQAVQQYQSYPVAPIVLSASYLGSPGGSAALVPNLGDFLGIRLQTFTGLSTTFTVYMGFEY